MKIKIKYNGRRFPRIVPVQGHERKSFQATRKVLELDEYDALSLLRHNIRINAERWEFTIVQEEQENIELPDQMGPISIDEPPPLEKAPERDDEQPKKPKKVKKVKFKK